jgi:hypothetical protein
MVLLGHDSIATLSIQLGSSLGPMLVIWTLGLVIISRLKRLNICLTYAISFLALGYVRHLVTGRPYFTEIGPITGPMYQLFIFFMITDPKTTVQPRWAQNLVAFLIAVVECVIRLLPGLPPYVNSHAPYLALFLVGPPANAIEIWRQGRKKPAPPAPAPAPA